MQDQDMVEKVARAMCQRQGCGGCWGQYCKADTTLAVAAIAAHEQALAEAGMVIVPREPTEAMCNQTLVCDHWETARPGVQMIDPIYVWRTMIAAAHAGEE